MFEANMGQTSAELGYHLPPSGDIIIQSIESSTILICQCNVKVEALMELESMAQETRYVVAIGQLLK